MTAHWLIWSNEHNAWWRPMRCGYTPSPSEAGRYQLEEAEQIVYEANCYLPPGTPPNETLVREDMLARRKEPLPKKVITSAHLHGTKEYCYDIGTRIGLEGEALERFLHALTEVEFVLEVDTETGSSRIVAVDGYELKTEEPK